MKKFLFIFAFCFFSLPPIAYAEETGLPQFVKINGAFSSVHFLLSQNIIKTQYVENEPITFVIDEKKLETVIPHDLLRTTTYSWNFGDGTKADGEKQTHVYQQSGSYIVVLTTTVSIEGFATPTQYRETLFINVTSADNNSALSNKSLWIVKNILSE